MNPSLIDLLRDPDWVHQQLCRKSVYPDCLLEFSKKNNQDKALEMSRLVGGLDGIAKRKACMLLFKFSKTTRRKKAKKTVSKEEDSNLPIYEQASNALWHFIDEFDHKTTYKCSKTSAKQEREKGLKDRWFNWMEQHFCYSKFLEYARAAEEKRLENARITVFLHFLYNHFMERAEEPFGEQTDPENLTKFRFK